MTGLVLQTQDDAPPGLLAPWAEARELSLEIARVDRADRLPDPRELDFAVALGSSASVVTPTEGWVATVIDWLRAADAADLPVLGICFGAQALAAALGARVHRLTKPEIGWIEAETLDADHIPPGPWVSWHEDGFELPPLAYELARNAYGVQAFCHRRHLAVQFHPEATAEIATAWDKDGRHAFAAGPAATAAAAAERLFDGFAARAGLAAGPGVRPSPGVA
jgi:GMP synthase-like glutamine amidotransferase